MQLQATTPIKLAPDYLTRADECFDPAAHGLSDKEIAWLLDIGAAVAAPAEAPAPAPADVPPARKGGK